MELHTIRNLLCSGKNINDLKLRVTYYARVSTDSILQLNSLNNQSEYFEEYIKSNINWEYVKGYIDEGISGTSDKRPSFLRMIEDAKECKFDLIITKEISRFSRNTLDSIKYTRYLLEQGVGVYFISDNINTIYSDSELRLTIMSSIAQDEVRRISERVKFGMRKSINDGNILGNDRLFGYRKNKKTGNLEIIKEEKEIILKIYDMFLYQNYSLTKIVKYLNSLDIKTSMNNKFSVTTLKRMIINPKYKGYYCSRKSEVIDYISKKIIYYEEKDWIMYKDYNKVPPIVSEEVWSLANNKIKKIENKKYKKCDSKYSTLIYCKNDEHLFYRRKVNNRYIWYCSNYLNNGCSACKNVSIYENELDEIIDYISKMKNVRNIINKIIVGRDNDYIELIVYLKDKIETINKKFFFKKSNRLYNVTYLEYVN